jgi:hypothetical protein
MSWSTKSAETLLKCQHKGCPIAAGDQYWEESSKASDKSKTYYTYCDACGRSIRAYNARMRLAGVLIYAVIVGTILLIANSSRLEGNAVFAYAFGFAPFILVAIYALSYLFFPEPRKRRSKSR